MRRLLLLALALSFSVSSAAASTDADALVGLWKAKRWSEPHVRSTLIIQRRGDAYTADIAGRVIDATVKGRELSFQLPNGRGEFRGRVEAGEISGWWYRPSAIPVRLHKAGTHRWMGAVDTFERTLTFYLLVQKRPDGSLGVLVDNPELDWGVRVGADTIVREGSVVKLVGKSVVATGTYDAEKDVITLPLANWGGTYDFKRETDDSDFYERGKNPGHYGYHQPPALDDGWPTQSPETAGIDRKGLEAAIQMLIDRPIDSNDTPLVDALLVARGGKLVLEEYFRGADRDLQHAVRSAQKSMTSVLAGAVMYEGRAPLSVSSPVYRVMNGGTFPSDLDARKRAMTLEHLLTMTSGLQCDDWDDNEAHNEDEMWDNQASQPDFYRYALNLPAARNPGEKAFYCSAGANLALGVIGWATGQSPVELFDRLLARPMQIDHYLWPFNVGGQPYGAGGATFRARDFLKFGQLMLNGGTWKGHRILSRDYVQRSTSPLYPLGRFHFGYLWWIHDYPYKDRTVRAFWAGGNGGQAVVVIPELDLAIATFGSNYFSAGGYYVQLEVIPKYILPAVRAQ